MHKKDKEALKKRLDKETPLLIKEGWNEKEINLLKTHFTFYLGLVNGDIKPINENHKNFIKNIKNRKNIKLDDSRIDGSFRISTGRNTTKDELKELIKCLQ